jgi:hypothetical protein
MNVCCVDFSYTFRNGGRRHFFYLRTGSTTVLITYMKHNICVLDIYVYFGVTGSNGDTVSNNLRVPNKAR